MIADIAISMKLDDTVNFTCIEELSRLIMGEEMLFHFVQSAAGVFLLGGSATSKIGMRKIIKSTKMKPTKYYEI